MKRIQYILLSLVLECVSISSHAGEADEVQLLSSRPIEYTESKLQSLAPSCVVKKQSDQTPPTYLLTCGKISADFNPNFVSASNLHKYRNHVLIKLNNAYFFEAGNPLGGLFDEQNTWWPKVQQTAQVLYVWLPNGFDEEGKASSLIASLTSDSDALILWHNGLYDQTGKRVGGRGENGRANPFKGK